MMKECIILAGGLGTRLRETVPDLPKCMAPVAGRPFLFYVIQALRLRGIDRFIFSLGYKHEIVEDYLRSSFGAMKYVTVVEPEPLGTGGGIRLACQEVIGSTVMVANGDTLLHFDPETLYEAHDSGNALVTLALKPMKNFQRYGLVETDPGGNVTAFREKQFYKNGLINAGVYLLRKNRFLGLDLPEKFSFETEILERGAGNGELMGVVQDGYFIDIGIPEDYQQAQTDLARPPLDLSLVDKEWTLLLDRDGVINVDHPGSYIFVPEDFVFLPGAPGIFKKLTSIFKHIVVTTNQRGVGRGLMTDDDLALVNKKMTDGITEAGGHIERIYAATALNDDDGFRKPNPGMAIQAKKDLPDIDLTKTIIIGNNISDMEFGKNAGLYTIFVTTTSPDVTLPHPDIDLIFPTLADFTEAL